MSTKRPLVLLLALALLFSIPAFALQEAGGVVGRVTREDGSPVGGVTVVIIETSAVQITDSGGNYSFNNVPVGDSYTISFTLGVNVETMTGVAVTAGDSTQVDLTVTWEVGFAETLTVVSASRRIDRHLPHFSRRRLDIPRCFFGLLSRRRYSNHGKSYRYQPLILRHFCHPRDQSGGQS